MFRIYGLTNSWTHQIIYVGQSVQPLPARLAQARYEWKKCKDGHRKHLAITGVYALGGKLGIIELGHAQDQAGADALEAWWITTLRDQGYAWGNTSAGGAGQHGVRRSRANRKKIARSLRAYHLKKQFTSSLMSILLATLAK